MIKSKPNTDHFGISIKNKLRATRTIMAYTKGVLKLFFKGFCGQRCIKDRFVSVDSGRLRLQDWVNGVSQRVNALNF